MGRAFPSSPVQPRSVRLAQAVPRRRRILRLVVLTLLGILATTMLPARPVGAHAALDQSEPAANTVVAVPPSLISLHFTEPLERSYSRAQLYDQTGNLVPAATSRAGDDAYAMAVDLPADLPHGTYSVVWRTLSEADGHTAEGYVPFTIGTEEDVATVAMPAATTSGGPPSWLTATSRWLALLGLAAVIAVWPVWLFVLRPAIPAAHQWGPSLESRSRRLAVGALAWAVIGSIIALLVQAAAVAEGGLGGLFEAVGTTLGDTRYGTLWLVRIGLFIISGVALMACSWGNPWRRWPVTVAALCVAAVLPLPFSLISHASAQQVGRAAAITGDVLHLLAASLWVGGLFVLVGALVPTMGDLAPDERRSVLGRVIPRFSLVALTAWGVMGLTGLYSAWLHVGNLTALRETTYGRSLILKVGLLVPLLVLGAFQLLGVTRRLRRADNPRSSAVWSRRFAIAIGIEAVLVVLVLLVVGRLIGQQPARDELAQESARVSVPLTADGKNATLFLTPGRPGPNHYRLELGQGHDLQSTNPQGQEALLRVELPERDIPQVEIHLARVAGSAFEGHGSELSIAGEWPIQAIIRQPGTADWSATAAYSLGTASAQTELPAPAWRFSTAGIGGLLLIVVGIAGGVLAWHAGASRVRLQSGGLGAASLVLGILLLLQARVDPNGEVAEAQEESADLASIERGAQVFTANCMVCHGPSGKGDGPAAAQLNPPPADLTAAHTGGHQDEDYAYWIANGIQGSAMPAFGEDLTPAEIEDVVAYVRSLQAESSDEDHQGDEGDESADHEADQED